MSPLRGLLLLFLTLTASSYAGAQPVNPILFVTQVPLPTDINNIVSTFGNHRAGIQAAPRGGDLYIRYADGALRNLTEAAGFGTAGLQGDNAIAVRDPCVHWSGKKALFSMVVGAPRRSETKAFYWQLYEITGLGQGETPSIVPLPRQPSGYNNISPVYGSDGKIFFVSDRPRDGAAHLFPQLDESLAFQSNTGLWKLDPLTGELKLLDHAPSGAFKPFVDSYGRVLFTRWDHLQRDLLGDDTDSNGAFNYTDESARAPRIRSRTELFPEPRSTQQKIASLNLHNFNQFTPWEIRQDGSEVEILNHLGRHELRTNFRRTFTDDANLQDFIVSAADKNQKRISNLFQIREDPLTPGRYIGVDSPQFDSHTSGQLISLDAPVGLTAEKIEVRYLTHRSTASTDLSPSPEHSGLYRDPLPLADGTLIASHSSYTGPDRNSGTREAPQSQYAFRLKTVIDAGEFTTAGAALTPGISKQVSYYDPSVLVSHSGLLWELQPVEVVARAVPPLSQAALLAPEQQAFTDAGVDANEFRQYLLSNRLAVMVSRNVTTRDAADQQQPFNLRVPLGAETLGTGGKVYDVSYLQIFEADLLRGYGGTKRPIPGRRVLPQPLSDPSVSNPPSPNGPAGAVTVATDGSVAAFVPAERALSWQLTAPNGAPVVRERYWITAQAGEIRVCTSCHGQNDLDQASQPPPTNSPQALRTLLEYWKERLHVAPGFRLSIPARLGPGRSATIKITPLNDSASSKALNLHLKVGGVSCGIIAHGFTSAGGKLSLRGKSPSLPGRVRTASLLFELSHLGRVTARSRVRLAAPAKAKSSRRLNGREVESICAGFRRFR